MAKNLFPYSWNIIFCCLKKKKRLSCHAPSIHLGYVVILFAQHHDHSEIIVALMDCVFKFNPFPVNSYPVQVFPDLRKVNIVSDQIGNVLCLTKWKKAEDDEQNAPFRGLVVMGIKKGGAVMPWIAIKVTISFSGCLSFIQPTFKDQLQTSLGRLNKAALGDWMMNLSFITK